MSDLGGEPACWAHLVGELDTGDQHDEPISVDLFRTGDDASGAIWSMPHGGDLDANLIRLNGGDAIDEHVNTEVDVLVIVWDGTGELSVDHRTIVLRHGIVVLIPRGLRRTIRAGTDGVSYLSIHRRRDPLTVGRRR